MISAFLFDFGGTLDGPLHWLDRFLDQYRAAGIAITRDELDQAYEHATRAGYRAVKVVQRFGMIDLIRFLVGSQVEFIARQGPERIRASLQSLDSRARHRTVEQITEGFVRITREGLEESRGVLETLKERFRIGVVSNFYGNLDRILHEAELTKAVDTVADSTQVGSFKPEARIFETALRELGVKPVDAVMVGDSLAKDCAPAHRLGLKTVWYRSGTSVHPHSEQELPVADLTIASLGELTSIRW